ncbi:DUF7155 family protein [Mycobacterium sp. WMMD1722]|uniref:DUF7155 family protein n=1 Tax=Mycobacterium sp. WMMD1722 TaxID=3404117 RepID=UPI003BF5AFBB
MTRFQRFVTVGAFAAAAVAAPIAAAAFTAPEAGVHAAPACLAWYGNKEDGICLGRSNGNGASIGTPSVAFGSGGVGVATGPLAPGQTIKQGVGGMR